MTPSTAARAGRGYGRERAEDGAEAVASCALVLRCPRSGLSWSAETLPEIRSLLVAHVDGGGCRGPHRLVDSRGRAWATSPRLLGERIIRADLDPARWRSLVPCAVRGCSRLVSGSGLAVHFCPERDLRHAIARRSLAEVTS